MTLLACKKESVEEESAEAIFLNQISGTWNLNAASLDGKEVGFSFPDLVITITQAKQVIVTNAVPPIWNGSAMFALEQVGNTFRLIRDDGVVMTLTQPTSQRLILTFQYDSDALGGRKKSISGQFIFEFTTP